jgi:hypothetical protein
VSRIPRMLDTSRYEVYWSVSGAEPKEMQDKIWQIVTLGMIVRQNKKERSGIYVAFHYHKKDELKAIQSRMKDLSPRFAEFGGKLDFDSTCRGNHGPEVWFQIPVNTVPSPAEVVRILDQFCEIWEVRSYEGFVTVAHQYNVRFTLDDGTKRWISEGHLIIKEARGNGDKAV